MMMEKLATSRLYGPMYIQPPPAPTTHTQYVIQTVNAALTHYSRVLRDQQGLTRGLRLGRNHCTFLGGGRLWFLQCLFSPSCDVNKTKNNNERKSMTLGVLELKMAFLDFNRKTPLHSDPSKKNKNIWTALHLKCDVVEFLAVIPSLTTERRKRTNTPLVACKVYPKVFFSYSLIAMDYISVLSSERQSSVLTEIIQFHLIFPGNNK